MQRLRSLLQRIDGRGYGAYKELQGRYQLGAWTLTIDHVQGDPFAPPSRLRLRLPLASAGFPDSCLQSRARRVALGDFLTRAFYRVSRQPPSGHADHTIRINVPGQEVLPRSSIAITDTHLETRLSIKDEDTSATNFMVRDRRMQELIRRSQEPITPFIDRVRQLYDQLGVSSILVVGGIGDYLDVADTVLQMDAFRPLDVTARARAIAAAWPEPARRRPEGQAGFAALQPRPVRRDSLSLRRGQRD